MTDAKLASTVRGLTSRGVRVVVENKRVLASDKGLSTLANILDVALNIHRRRRCGEVEVNWVSEPLRVSGRNGGEKDRPRQGRHRSGSSGALI